MEEALELRRFFRVKTMRSWTLKRYHLEKVSQARLAFQFKDLQMAENQR